MDWKKRKTSLMGLVGGIGVVLLIAGIFGVGVSFVTGLVLALAVWIIGATLINVLILD
jgi:hypothetical protein